jgi:hypothetical protein
VSRRRTRLSGNGRPKGRGSYIATYSNNTTIKIGDTVTFNRTISGSNFSESYTVPANSYLVVYRAAFNVGFGAGANITYQYPGHSPIQLTGGIPNDFEYQTSSYPSPIVAANPFAKTFPAGTVFVFSITAAGGFSASYSFAAQLFQNTP